jgi:2-polyprenyl-3-methyl-5-hydroxy-6-metoxy-1,4-benzoquinol methylase
MKIFRKKYQKSAKIVSILSEFKDMSQSKILDIGCGNGMITSNIGNFSKEIIGIDVKDRRIVKKGYKFKLIKDEMLPFENNSFDVVISNQVIEHVNNQDRHVEEIYRVLRNGGICYLATPNKHWPIEPHYYLPFLGILPNKLANIYLRIFINKDYDVKLLSYYNLTKKLSKYFTVDNFTFKVIKNPKKYNLEKKYNFIPKFFFNFYLIKLFVPSFILVLRKK